MCLLSHRQHNNWVTAQTHGTPQKITVRWWLSLPFPGSIWKFTGWPLVLCPSHEDGCHQTGRRKARDDHWSYWSAPSRCTDIWKTLSVAFWLFFWLTNASNFAYNSWKAILELLQPLNIIIKRFLNPTPKPAVWLDRMDKHTGNQIRLYCLY